MFADESCVQQTPNVVRTWAPVGCPPVLKCQATSRSAGKVNMIGGLAWSPATGEYDVLLCMQPQEGIDSGRVVKFLGELHEMIAKPITLVWDNLKAHHSRLVQAYVKENAEWLELVFLPPYCPELNPIEYLWSAWKRACLANYCPKSADEICDLMLKYEDAMSDQKLLKGCLLAAKLVTKEELLG